MRKGKRKERKGQAQIERSEGSSKGIRERKGRNEERKKT